MALLSLDRQREIDAKIEAIKAHTGMSYPSNDILDIIRAYVPGIEIRDYDFNDDSQKIKGAIKYPDGEGTPAILINANRLSPAERTFTVTHEFGHYELHKNQEKFRLDLFDYKEDTDTSLQESEANYFAASFLMPREEFEDMLFLTDDVSKIAAYFGVSILAVEKRREWLKKNKRD